MPAIIRWLKPNGNIYAYNKPSSAKQLPGICKCGNLV